MFGSLKENTIYNCSYKDKIFQISDNSVDMVLTDIPYGVSKETRLKGINDYTKLDGESNWKGSQFSCDIESFDLDDYLFHCCRILKPSRSIIVWSAWQQLKSVDDRIKQCLGELKKEPRIGIWKKTNPPVFNMKKMALQPYEFFVWNRKGSNVIFNNQNGMYINSKEELRQHPEIHFYSSSAPSNRKLEGKHQNAKPVAIFEWLIRTYTNEKDERNRRSVIFDGCMGGGTTAVAAIKAGREFIGFEINKQFFDIANSRIEKLLEK